MVDSLNSSATQRKIVLSITTCLIAVSLVGCRCQQPYPPQQYTPYNTAPPLPNPAFNPQPGFNGPPQFNTAPTFNNGFGPNNAGGRIGPGSQTRISAPATYSLNIPGVNNNGSGTRVGQLPSGLLNTRQTAPTPANRPANFNQTQGWRQANGNNLNTSSIGQPVVGSRVADASLGNSGFASSTGVTNSNGGPNVPTVSLPNASASGVSFTRSNDYRTTSIDERRDNTRLPITDATNVRSTTPFAQNQSGNGQYVQPYYEPRQQNQPRFAQAGPTTYQGAFVQPNNANFNGLPQSNQGNFAQSFSSAQPQRQVLAQSTARYDPFGSSASTASNDWRDRGRRSY